MFTSNDLLEPPRPIEFEFIRENSTYFIYECLMYKTGLCINIIEDFKGYKKPSLALCEHFTHYILLLASLFKSSFAHLKSPGIIILSTSTIFLKRVAKI